MLAHNPLDPTVPRQSGYPREWFSSSLDLSDLQCPICADVLFQPTEILRCGHVFCAPCLASAFQKGGTGEHRPHTAAPRCPCCRQETQDETHDAPHSLHISHRLERQIGALEAQCVSCGDWKGGFGLDGKGLGEHWGTHCPRVELKCPYDAAHVYFRGENPSHLHECPEKPVECEWCTEEIQGSKMAAHLEHECYLRPRECPNGCDVVQPRTRKRRRVMYGNKDELQYHLDDDCPLQVIECPYAPLGCTFREPRGLLDAHVTSKATYHVLLWEEDRRKAKSKTKKPDSPWIEGIRPYYFYLQENWKEQLKPGDLIGYCEGGLWRTSVVIGVGTRPRSQGFCSHSQPQCILLTLHAYRNPSLPDVTLCVHSRVAMLAPPYVKSSASIQTILAAHQQAHLLEDG